MDDRCDRCRHRQYRCPDCDERAYQQAGRDSVWHELRARSMKAARYWKR